MDPVWEQLHSSRDWGRYPSVDLISRVLREFRGAATPGVRVLEVGCGAGANLSFFLQEGFQVCGIDGSESAIRKARERLAGLPRPGQEFELRVGDFRKLPWPDASFDLVVDYLALYANRMAVIRDAMGECRRVLKPGGFFFSRSWSRGCTGDQTGSLVEAGTSDGPTEGPCARMGTSHFFDRAELDELFAGFFSRDLVQVTTDWKTRDYCTLEWIVWAKK